MTSSKTTPIPRSTTPDASAPPRLFLASRSPRRRELLTQRGYAYDFDHPGLEDGDLRPGQVSPPQWVASLAYLKAAAGLDRYRAMNSDARVILGADTTCVIRDQMVGTPLSAREAEAMIRAFINHTHHVVSGVALLCPTSRLRHLFTDSATVHLGPLTDAQIGSYVDSGQWRGKAGAYNLSERIGAGWPLTFQGDPATIMGLPMNALARHITRFVALLDPALVSSPPRSTSETPEGKHA